MKFELKLLLDKPIISTRDYRRIFTSIIKSALSTYRNGEKLQEYYGGTGQKDFTWTVIFDKPEFKTDAIQLGGNEVKMVISAWDRNNTGYFLFSAFSGIKNKPLPLPEGNSIVLKGIALINQRVICCNSCIFSTALGAPFIVREHSREDNKDEYYTIGSPDFSQKIEIALQKQAIMVGFPEEVIKSIRAKALSCSKNVVYRYGVYADANVGTIELQGEPEILQYFYQGGILAHHSQGFGMLNLVAQMDK